ncbi:acetyl/propionyl/methylcrotonyl-CoA carboxylase subunit alpha [Variovorax sp. PCZ-1]|uniref:acetyl/propionyl/methylcrotonyl-CoA carboxylase subunit alpha n=1 Tax=Variovorax sp. PCZ-1 TaxID=2835533 RepID=UPI001BCB4E3A|nr:acetyl/propionyl/methylcrotonyl-CoA carboxylase subunit alpha [Variovorax sp. PCZ-1]MBS7808273.1 acetyl/propionyl/methylcrotonyl-CoA carboxylase subunit alpha [Variovorax sp. PCZ-1]
MFTKILIANRGEIACRVAATARKMAIQTVAVYSKADAQAKHVAACDEAVYIGEGEGNSPKESYLRWQAILAAAQATGAQAIHPGYGFLSENEDFAQACADAGLVFIGPPPSAIKAMGLKAESKQLMEKAGVPLVPGYHGANQDEALLQKEADRIGYPALIKASAGGGGKGMRIVERSEDFAAALASCKREAINSFGDEAVLIEKYVQRPRHIEIQVFGDAHGNYVYLFERDCSVQRRHQKVLEEAPAPGMPQSMREAMGKAAVDAARAVNYTGAGTVEFIVEQQGGYDAPDKMKFYFMEMNTRLQVEHPVTEAITGLDLVEWQLRVASNEKLPMRQDQLKINGHAIEARICAENPDNGFLPATGSLNVYRKPLHSAFERSDLRIDDGVRQGDAISPYYDSMIAKLIVHGATREEALAKLDRALSETQIVGLATNVQFLRHVVKSDAFAQGKLDTALIQREEKVLFHQEKLPLAGVISAWIAHVLIAERASQTSDPFSKRDGWRPFGITTRRFAFEWHDQPVQAELSYLHDGATLLHITQADTKLQGLLTCEQDATVEDLDVKVSFADQRFKASVHASSHEKGQVASIFTAQGATQLIVIDPFIQIAEGGAQAGRLTAPMPGKLVSFAVKAGDTVKAGQTLAVMEAMKMEHTIAAPKDGVVSEILFAPGDQVSDGAELIKLAA